MPVCWVDCLFPFDRQVRSNYCKGGYFPRFKVSTSNISSSEPCDLGLVAKARGFQSLIVKVGGIALFLEGFGFI